MTTEIIMLIVGVLLAEGTEVAPWLAKRLVRWSARVRHLNAQRAEIRAEELAAVIDSMPGKLFKLTMALLFTAQAGMSWTRRTIMRRLQGKKINKDIADTATEPESSPTETDFHKSDTPTRAPAMPRSRRSGTGLSAKVLPELQKMARDLGISGAGRMRKSQLIYAIQEKRAALQETQTEDTS